MRTPLNRRRLIVSGIAAAIASRAVRAQTSGPRVVVVGGGFGGAACARALRKADPRIAVTLVEQSRTYTASPMSNAVIAGLRDLSQQQFGYDKIAHDGVTVALSAAAAIDPHARSVALADGTKLAYDRLVLSPGIDFRWDAIAGYDEAAAALMPHAYKGADQIALLRRQLEGMEDGGLVAISAPVNPARCPPAPYERASLIAYYLKRNKPRSKIVILDAKDSFAMHGLFQDAWKALYPGLIEWVPVGSSGLVTSVDPKTRTLSTDFDNYKAAVANVIPPQKAGHVAELAGAADRTGWCPVNPITFQSRLDSNVHVIGDAAIAGAMPRAASAAQVQAKICADAIVAHFAGTMPWAPTLTSSCFSLIAPDYAISQRSTFRPVGEQYEESPPGIVVSPRDAAPTVRNGEAKEADAWFAAIAAAEFG
jgi:sulfide dehydrogenase [flavocytochrome c] flavoprotein subunit